MPQITITMTFLSTRIPSEDQVTLYETAAIGDAAEQILDYSVLSRLAVALSPTELQVQVTLQPGARMLAEWPTPALRQKAVLGIYPSRLSTAAKSFCASEAIVEVP